MIRNLQPTRHALGSPPVYDFGPIIAGKNATHEILGMKVSALELRRCAEGLREHFCEQLKVGNGRKSPTVSKKARRSFLPPGVSIANAVEFITAGWTVKSLP